ncbi:unnamed protein product [marine sediment metagenome]|uniref:Uncharacterized protein n=1 Tax=marine sediment metagenome TaxID=412755 RepID=X1T531_9ZZZZ
MKNPVWQLIKFAYSTILRKLVLDAIDNPDSEIDEFVMRLLDNLFEYQTNN